MDITEPLPMTQLSSTEHVPYPSSAAPSATSQPNPSSTTTTQESRPPVATTLSVLQTAITIQGNTAASTIDNSRSTSIIPFPTASPRLRLDTQFDATIADSNETVAAVAAAVLLLAIVTVVVIVGVIVAVFVCCRRRRARSGARCTGVCICVYIAVNYVC